MMPADGVQIHVEILILTNQNISVLVLIFTLKD